METTSSTSGASSPDEPLEPSTAAPPRRSGRMRRQRAARVRPWLGDRMTPTTLFGLMAALAVFVLVIVLLQDRREMVTVAMTSERVPAGGTITEGMVERAEVPASVRFSGDLVPFDEAVGRRRRGRCSPASRYRARRSAPATSPPAAGDGDPGGVVAGGRRSSTSATGWT